MDKTLNQFVANYLWSEKVADYSAPRRKLIHLLRYVYVVLDDLAKGELTLRAMSLVYTTLLSLVPMMAVSFSVLKAFGMHNKQLQPIMLQFLAPMGAQGVEITDKIIGFIDNVKIGVLGTFGVALLFYTAISLIQKVEATFNYIWRLDQHRSIGRRFADYGSVMLIGPLLVFSAIGLSASVLSGSFVQAISHQLPFMQYLITFATEAAPYLMIIAAFSFFYMFIPNTRVTVRAGLIAGVVSGFLFQSLGWGFGSVVVSASGSGTYAIYSGFAILILFMMWMYISWLILLVGSSVAFYVQHPEYVAPTRRSGDLSIKQREVLALQIMGVIAERHYKSRKPFSASDFVLRLRVQIQGVTKVLRALKEAGLITENSEEPARYLPNAPLEKTSLKQVIDAVRSEGNASMLGLGAPRRPVHGVAAVAKAIDDALDAALAATSVRDMAIEDDGSAPDSAEAGKNN
ncbi:ribonuclease BN [gamma proteobacterium BDW918]|jgi:membrane protein|uniref:Ribonuclease BN n=1 Tax=Zhongshania aliphaticivorans TaxID=1470434 RepID=A0A127M2E9_9GAMM|nr:YihY/virulence factor BrkB family protein [Zhongshania aliphaticivorans]AMO67405.1 ribonuclease BN [Zhongshania aliphaticivorans]EIF42907.1 ribonuclease BN [gamma proteobacterium BDW918]